MKKIEAIVRNHKVDDIKNALVKEGFLGMTITEVQGYGRQRGHKETYRGAEYQVDFVPKVKLEIAAKDNEVNRILDIIVSAARSGQIGDGKVFVTDLGMAVRIRTGETGEAAL
ncbi:MAG: P-II family nitrogen regulator [Planctomycetota bacterium]